MGRNLGIGLIPTYIYVMELTNKENQVLHMLAEGFRPKEIGQGLGMSPRTVESHLKMIKTKMGAKTLPHVIKIAHDKKMFQ